MGDELFLQIDQIIPTPEAKEFMIGISAKNQESKKVEKEKKIIGKTRERGVFYQTLKEQ